MLAYNQNSGLVNALLAILWKQPDKQKTCRALSDQAAKNPEVWTAQLSAKERVWMAEHLSGMALFGESLIILDSQNDWVRVSFPSCTEYDSGWLPACHFHIPQLSDTTAPVHSTIVVSSPTAMLYCDPFLHRPYGQLSYQVRLPLLEEQDLWFRVCLPTGGNGYLPREDARRSEDLTFSTGNIVVEARQFLGLPCLSRGTSAYGFDCAGLAFRIYQSQGVSIPRHVSRQANAGFPVDQSHLVPGDLLFFALGNSSEDINHVGIFSGGNNMIHAPGSQSAIKEESFAAEPYHKGFRQARRYHPTSRENGTIPVPHC